MLMKIGGKAFDDRKGFMELAGAIKENHAVDFIIVHGGGAEISQALQAAGRPTHFVDGIRVTRAEDVAIVERVLTDVNSRIAGYLEEGGVSCGRLSGKTDSLLLVEPLKRGGQDFGFVGEIKKVNPAPIVSSLANQQVPVVSPVSVGEDGGTYNVNADSAAAALAIASECTDLLLLHRCSRRSDRRRTAPPPFYGGRAAIHCRRKNQGRYDRQTGIGLRGPEREGPASSYPQMAGTGDPAGPGERETF